VYIFLCFVYCFGDFHHGHAGSQIPKQWKKMNAVGRYKRVRVYYAYSLQTATTLKHVTWKTSSTHLLFFL
jgi:hypothetical protein